MAVRFRIQHLDHGGGVISTHTPVGGTLEWSYVANDVGDIGYQLPLSDVAISRDGFAPYRTDWRLQQQISGGTWQSLAAGIHVPVNIVSDSDAVNVAGKDWSHWLEQPVWFDYYSYNYLDVGQDYSTRKRDIVKADKNWGPGITDSKAALAFYPPATQAQIVSKLIDKSKEGRDGYYVNITPVFSGTAGSGDLTYAAIVIYFQDQTSILQHINTVAAIDDPWGFDWTMNWNKQMEFFGPRKTVKTSPTPIWTITKDMILEMPMLDMDWTNNGPLATHLVGLSQGSPAAWWIKRDPESIQKYRGWLRLENVGDQYIWKEPFSHAVNGLDYLYPQKDIKITVMPEVLDVYEGFKNHVGDVIRVKWDFPPYHEVNAYYWITEQRFSGDAAGNFKCSLGLQQIYDIYH